MSGKDALQKGYDAPTGLDTERRPWHGQSYVCIPYNESELFIAEVS